MKYQVGDVVLVKVTIDSVDKSTIPYRDQRGHWFRPEEVFALVERPEPEPEPETRFHKGDRVIYKDRPEWGVGVILEYDGERAYEVEYAHKAEHDGQGIEGMVRTGNCWITSENNLLPA